MKGIRQQICKSCISICYQINTILQKLGSFLKTVSTFQIPYVNLITRNFISINESKVFIVLAKIEGSYLFYLLLIALIL
jgi:hypothetical protein